MKIQLQLHTKFLFKSLYILTYTAFYQEKQHICLLQMPGNHVSHATHLENTFCKVSPIFFVDKLFFYVKIKLVVSQ